MKALSTRHPHAWLIVHGLKPIENRTWRLPKTFVVPQRVYIHAGLRQDYDAYEDATSRRLVPRIRQLISADANWDWDNEWITRILGAIVGEVTITGCVTESESPWFEGPFGFTLEDGMAYERPIPYRGRLGFFEVPQTLIMALDIGGARTRHEARRHTVAQRG